MAHTHSELIELKVGLSEKTILKFFHPDAVDYFNVTNNLRKVCEDLKDPAARISQDVRHLKALTFLNWKTYPLPAFDFPRTSLCSIQSSQC